MVVVPLISIAVNLDLIDVQNHICNLVEICQQHRQNADQYFDQNISREALELSKELEIDLALPRYRSNIHAGNVKDYFRQQLFIPYLNSLITSLTTRFSADHTVPFKIACLIPAHFVKLSRLEFCNAVYKISSMYPIESFSVEAMT